MAKNWVVISDLQCPSHNQRAVDVVCEFIADYGFDGALCVGDDTDSPEPSKWSRGMAEEYSSTLQAGLRKTHAVHAQFREALGEGKPYHVERSNHGDRVRTYVRKYAPALASLDVLKIENLLGYDELGITYHEQPYEFAPGWLLMHGDESSLNSTPGGTALGLARSTGMSVVCGHTHRLGIQHMTVGYNGKQKFRYGVEVGHMMDVRKAHYLKSGSANWHAGFGIFHVDGSLVTPYLVPVLADGSFSYDGVRYGGKAKKTVIA